MFFDADTGKTAKKECRRVMGRDKDGKILANEHGHGNVMSTGGKFFTDTQDEGHEPKEERVRAQHHADGTRQGANENRQMRPYGLRHNTNEHVCHGIHHLRILEDANKDPCRQKDHRRRQGGSRVVGNGFCLGLGAFKVDGKGKGTGTLMDYGIKYDEAPLKADFTPDYELIAQKAPGAKVCHIQRSRGYLQRNAFDLDTIRRVADTARAANPDIIVFVDNCYGEFTQKEEPCQAGADLVVGSLIKNPGGGIAPTGGYIAGRKDLVELCAYRLNAPGLGKELGCTLETPRDMYLGFYYAPGVVCEAIKTAIYAQCLLELVGKKPIPRYCEAHNDIVTCFDAGTADALIGFCRGVQAASPVDSYAAPEPSPEPGYTDEVIMASGSFTQGSTIELSCDGPLREPYTCYLQGGLNFAASRAGVLLAVQNAYFKD